MAPSSAIFAAISTIRPEHATTKSGARFSGVMAVYDGCLHVAARICELAV